MGVEDREKGKERTEAQETQETPPEFNEELQEYFKETTVHGFRYVVEGRSTFERWVWILFILFGFVFSGYIIWNVFDYWTEFPVHITVDEVSAPVKDVPYPAITVCDSESLQMPRRNRWKFLERFLNAAQLKDEGTSTDHWIKTAGTQHILCLL